MKFIAMVLAVLAVSCSSNRYFVVRHAEKAVVTKDSSGYTPANPPLSEAGKVRSFVLRDELKGMHIKNIFSTNYHRTISTAQPLADARGIAIQTYSPSKDSLSAFVDQLKAIKKARVLIVGHSNTIDDLINKLCGDTKVPGDLSEAEYDNLFIIKTDKNGKFELLTRKKYGYPSNPEK